MGVTLRSARLLKFLIIISPPVTSTIITPSNYREISGGVWYLNKIMFKIYLKNFNKKII